jgi:hypothetical protein
VARRKAQAIVFPMKGLNQNWGEDNQPVLTSDDLQNVRPYDGGGNRARGGSRPGTSKYIATAMGEGKIQGLCQATQPYVPTGPEYSLSSFNRAFNGRDNRLLSLTDWEVRTGTNFATIDADNSDLNEVAHIPDGGLPGYLRSGTSTGGVFLKAALWKPSATGTLPTNFRLKTNVRIGAISGSRPAMGIIALFKDVPGFAPDSIELQLQFDTFIIRRKVNGSTVDSDTYAIDPDLLANTTNEVRLDVDGDVYTGWLNGVQQVSITFARASLGTSFGPMITSQQQNDGLYDFTYLNRGPEDEEEPVGYAQTFDTGGDTLLDPDVWEIRDNTTNFLETIDGSLLHETDDGMLQTVDVPAFHIAAILKSTTVGAGATAYSISAEIHFNDNIGAGETAEAGFILSFQRVSQLTTNLRITFDREGMTYSDGGGNTVFPYPGGDLANDETHTFYVTRLGNDYDIRVNGTLITTITLADLEGTGLGLYIPNGENAGLGIVSFAYEPTFTVNTTTADKARRVYLVTCCDGTIRAGQPPTLDVPTNGTDAMDVGRFVSMAEASLKVYLADGDNLKVLDLVTETVSTLAASSGAVPTGVRNLVVWRNRLIGYGKDGEEQNIFMSAVGDPTNWDYAARLQTAAVALNATSNAGGIGQPVLALIPFRDDILIIGCDHSIFAMTGDPAAGGRINTLSDAIGIYGPDAWTISPEGMIYFVGSGGFYRMAPGGQPENISRDRTADFFMQVNRAEERVIVRWNAQEHGCYIFRTNVVVGTTEAGMFYDARQDGFFPQRYPNVQEPTAALVYDGDGANDRHLIIGGRDGYLRKIDKDCWDDDGTGIDSYVFFGPMQPYGPGSVARMVELEAILGDNADMSAPYQIRVGESANEALASSPVTSGAWQLAGRNPLVRTRTRANTFYLIIQNTAAETRWSMERITAIFEPAGRER